MSRTYGISNKIDNVMCLSISIFSKYLKTNGNIIIEGSVKWGSGSAISYKLSNCKVALTYGVTIDNERFPINYTITIGIRESNLGVGNVYYFICPFTGKWCRNLYLPWGCKYFGNRTSFNNRLYYDLQACSKKDFHNDKYWNLKREIEFLEKKIIKNHYRGEDTKLQQRINKKKAKAAHYDRLRMNEFTSCLPYF